MAFQAYFPLGETQPTTLITPNGLTRQIWHELVALRYSKRQKVAAPKATGSWIDQAKLYYLDATNSDWRTSGLLYYYSFLNLAKALLVAKREYTYKKLDSTPIYHGLASDLQAVDSILDFEIVIHPVEARGKHNVFATLYQLITKKEWPFKRSVKIKVSDFLGYSSDISTELDFIFEFQGNLAVSQSLVRRMGEENWFEMSLEKRHLPIFEENIDNWNYKILSFPELDQHDRLDWLSCYNRSSVFMSQHVIIRGPKVIGSWEEQYLKVTGNAQKYLNGFAIPTAFEEPQSPEWYFVPKIELANRKSKWHPILSNYLFSFVLSTILRYQPQLFKPSEPSHFLAESWCGQAPLTTLSYFLMSFTKPALRLRSIK